MKKETIYSLRTPVKQVEVPKLEADALVLLSGKSSETDLRKTKEPCMILIQLVLTGDPHKTDQSPGTPGAPAGPSGPRSARSR